MIESVIRRDLERENAIAWYKVKIDNKISKVLN
jgi:hypothetical protein